MGSSASTFERVGRKNSGHIPTVVRKSERVAIYRAVSVNGMQTVIETKNVGRTVLEGGCVGV